MPWPQLPSSEDFWADVKGVFSLFLISFWLFVIYGIYKQSKEPPKQIKIYRSTDKQMAEALEKFNKINRDPKSTMSDRKKAYEEFTNSHNSEIGQ